MLFWPGGWVARGTSVMDGVGEVGVIGWKSVLSEMLTST